MTENANFELFNINDEIEFNFTNFIDDGEKTGYTDELIRYYDLKYKICRALTPNRIFENDMGKGLNALVFLQTAPYVEYHGVSRAPEGNQKTVLTKNQNQSLSVEERIKVYNQMDDYTNGQINMYNFDLFHITGDLSGDQIYDLLEWGLQKCKWLWIDKYYANTDIMLATNFFTQKYSDFIEFIHINPLCAGNAVIKLKENFIQAQRNYKTLESEYDEKYYLTNCGGYDVFLESGGSELDSRLNEVYQLINPEKGERILDVGCGRGELAFALANSGAEVLGVDYSGEAISIAKKNFEKCDNLKLTFVNGDVLALDENKKFDKIVMADVYEHIEEENLIKLLIKLKEMLNENGKLFIHTAPNKDYYDTVYKDRVAKAKQIGLYLPQNPRSIYEDIMHINEQTPTTMKITLNGVFDNILLWAGDVQTVLIGKESLESNQENQIYALCSMKDDISEYINSIKYKPLDVARVDVKISSEVQELSILREGNIEIEVLNSGNVTLASKEPYPVKLSYHVLDEHGNVLIYDGIRTELKRSLSPLEKMKLKMKIYNHDLNLGMYVYRITMVQENNFWFDEAIKAYFDVRVNCGV